MHGELVVLSHLRWDWVWQRPQHLISRLGRTRRTWFVEEPLPLEIAEPRLRVVEDGVVTRVWLEVPGEPGTHVGFDDARAATYGDELVTLLGAPGSERIVWLYTPLALAIAEELQGDALVYDVMDDLASFKGASPELVLRQAQTLREADVVFTGGRSLHRSVVDRRPVRTFCFPSGVEPEHYAAARSIDVDRRHRVAGYVGVIDERLDLDLLAGVAARLPDWELRIVGPVCKIDEGDLPRAENIVYPGPKGYDELPAVMAGFDVALMPFALNEATRSISPTKTLEYLAAGLPVVSTRVPDVVADYAGVVALADGVESFAEACVRVVEDDGVDRDEKVRTILYEHHWDTIAERMAALVAARGVIDLREADEELSAVEGAAAR